MKGFILTQSVNLLIRWVVVHKPELIGLIRIKYKYINIRYLTVLLISIIICNLLKMSNEVNKVNAYV